MVGYPSDHARCGDGDSCGEREVACAAAGGCVREVGKRRYGEYAPCACVCVHGLQDRSGRTALILAVRDGRTGTAQALIDAGADLNVQVC